jgi:hypothetical protein
VCGHNFCFGNVTHLCECCAALIFNSQSYRRIITYHAGSIKKTLLHLYPDIGLDKNKLLFLPSMIFLGFFGWCVCNYARVRRSFKVNAIMGYNKPCAGIILKNYPCTHKRLVLIQALCLDRAKCKKGIAPPPPRHMHG